MRIAWMVAAVACLAGAWVTVDWYRSREAVLSMAPERSSTDLEPRARRSTVLADLVLPFPVIEKALNDLAPALKGTQEGSKRIGEVARQDIDVRWSIDHDVNGPIGVSRKGDKLEIALPGKFNGTVGVPGDIARFLRLDDKKVDGSFVVTASAGLEIGKDFCPRIVPGDVSLEWDREARVEVIGRNRAFGASFGPFYYAFGGDIEGPVEDALETELAKQRDAIPCDPVRAALQDLWSARTVPVEIEAVPDLAVQITPTSLSASDLLVQASGLRFLVQLGFDTLVTDRPGPAQDPGDLPVNGGLAARSGEIDLAVPLALTYPAIRSAALNALGSGPLTVTTDAGEVVLDDLDVEVYPSGERIAIGIDFSADLPRRLFDASGTLWLTAAPVVTETGDGVLFEDIQVTRQTDSALWNVLSAAFEQRLRSELEKTARLDLSAQRDQAMESIAAALSSAGQDGGVDLDLVDADLRLDSISAGSEALIVVALYTAGVETTLVDIDF